MSEVPLTESLCRRLPLDRVSSWNTVRQRAVDPTMNTKGCIPSTTERVRSGPTTHWYIRPWRYGCDAT